MKELSIEEKAKRYDEALWKAGELYQPSYSALLEEIFPELIKYNNEKVRGAIIHFISHTPTVPIGRINKETMLAWLEKQGKTSPILSNSSNTGKIEQKTVWSEEDERTLQGIWDEILANKHDAPDYDLATYDRFLSWLKSLKDRVGCEAHCTTTKEWSEEDDKNLEKTIWYVEKGGKLIFAKTDELVSWLKSLRPQKQWKPSEKQIDALEHFVRSIGESGYASPYDNNTKLLYSLLEQLKKL